MKSTNSPQQESPTLQDMGEHQQGHQQGQPKNVPKELMKFLQEHPKSWYTNEQLATFLEHTPSGIRNAVTKLKSSNLIQTHLTGNLAYRAWHSASIDDFAFPLPDSAKKLAARKCNACQTTNSRYWRSDLEEKNAWLCNNCGMNQRRGRGRSGGVGPSSQLSQEDYMPPSTSLGDIAPSLGDIAPSAEPIDSPPPPIIEQQAQQDIFTGADMDVNDEAEDNSVDSSYNPSGIPISFGGGGGKRRPPNANYVDPSKRKCNACKTTKSAGKWRRDRNCPEKYLCNKCGMNQRRTQMRAEQQQQLLLKQQEQIQHAASATPYDIPIITQKGRHAKLLPCSLCQEKLPTFVADCTHRLCGECLPSVLLNARGQDMVGCPICPLKSSLIPLQILGDFVDSLMIE